MKKFLSTICVICMLIISLTGCSLIETNMQKYLAAPVAKAGDVTVNMEELIDGLNSFGYERYTNTENNQTGNTTEQVITKTIDDLLNRKFVLQYIEKEKNITLTDYEKNKAKSDAYDAINKALSNYEDEIRIEWDIVSPSKDAEAADEEAAKNLYTPFKKKVIKENGKYKYVDDTTKEEDNSDYDYVMNLGDFKFESAGADSSAAGDEEKKVFIEAKARLFRTLRKNNKNRGGSDKTDEELLKQEIEKYTNNNLDNAKVTKLTDSYLKDMKTSDGSIDILMTNVASTFKNEYNKAKNEYVVDATGKIPSSKIESYESTMKSITEPILYHPIENSYFYVSHILIGYTDEQKAALEEYKTKVKNGQYTYEDLQAFTTKLAGQIRGQARNSKTGVQEGELVSVDDIYSQAILAVSGKVSDEVKAARFSEIMYKYSTDPGTLNAVQHYAIPLDSSKDQMVPEFANTSRDLRKTAIESGKNMIISKPVLTENGYHIIIYVGEVKNQFTNLERTEDIDSIVNTLNATYTKLGHNQTYFDYFVDKTEEISADNFLDAIVKAKRDNLKIKLYKDNYKNLLKG